MLVDVDNKSMCNAYVTGEAKTNGCTKTYQTPLLDAARKGLQTGPVMGAFRVQGKADNIYRPEGNEHVRSLPAVFNELWSSWDGFDKDLMASTEAVHVILAGPACGGTPLPFYSRYHIKDTVGVDVLSHNVCDLPGSEVKWFGF